MRRCLPRKRFILPSPPNLRMPTPNNMRVLLTILLVSGTPSLLHAQRNIPSELGASRDSVPNGSAIPLHPPAATDTVCIRKGRIPAVAGILSYAFPGTGSFYAGHLRHGVTHVIIAYSILSLSLSDGSPFSSESSGYVLLPGYVLNWGWSIVSAVRDARANNRPVRPKSHE